MLNPLSVFCRMASPLMREHHKVQLNAKTSVLVMMIFQPNPQIENHLRLPSSPLSSNMRDLYASVHIMCGSALWPDAGVDGRRYWNAVAAGLLFAHEGQGWRRELQRASVLGVDRPASLNERAAWSCPWGMTRARWEAEILGHVLDGDGRRPFHVL